MTLSKSLYTRGIQCQKALWLKKYKSDVLTPPDDSALAIFERGNVVGDLACELFPAGKKVPFTRDYDEMISTTKEWIDDGVSNIYEATFNYDGILVMVDVLHVDSDGVHIYEVKSSTSVKDIYVHDVSIQYYVLKSLGFNVKSANVVHINSSYVRGDELDIDELFSIVDVTDDALALQENIPHVLREFEECLSDKENEPHIDIGKHCKNPYECDAKDYCWRVQRGIPDYSMFNIFNLGSKKQVELYEQGIINIDDISDGFAMTEKQKQAVQNYKSKKTHIDPIELLAQKLCEDIPRDVTVLAYNMGFEKGVIKKLASNYPELSEHLLHVSENIIDLMTPFQQKHYVTPNMNGTYSIKYVLPALVPKMAQAYKELEGVQNGGQAMNAFANMSKLGADEKKKMRNSLLEYCKLDTLAMVRVLGKLKEVVKT
jgi:hypothetical protein